MKTTEGQRAEWKRRAEIVNYPERCDTLPIFAFVLLDLIDDIDKLQADRKALLEALRAALAAIDAFWPEDMAENENQMSEDRAISEVRRKARAAIAQAEKES